MHSPSLQPRHTRPNPIRAIGELAALKTQEFGLPWFCELHLGNPGTEQEGIVPAATSASVTTRTAGYAPHHGAKESRARVAEFFNDAEGVDEVFSPHQVMIVPGATVITDILLKAVSKARDSILLPRIGYPPYENQVSILDRVVVHYEFNSEGLVTFHSLRAALEKSIEPVALIIITYPHNPTGKSLTNEEAKKVATALNEIHEHFPSITFYNDAVYNATVTAERGYQGFFKYLSDSAKKVTVSGLSGAKMTAQGAERVGAVACLDLSLMNALENILSGTTAGTNVHAEVGFIAALEELKGTFSAGPFNPTNPRHRIAEFYGSRRGYVADALDDVTQRCGITKGIEARDEGGSMYVYAKCGTLLRGRSVPEQLREEVGSRTFESGTHLMKYLLALPLLGFASVATVPGEAFGDAESTIALRLSCVQRNSQMLEEAMHSFRGAMQSVLALDLGVQPQPDLQALRSRLRGNGTLVDSVLSSSRSEPITPSSPNSFQ